MSHKFVLIDVRREWKKLKKHLHQPIVEAALGTGMQAFCEQHTYSDRKIFNHDKGPWYYTKSDYWAVRKSPKKDTIGWYQCIGACHWLRGFACALGELVYPDLEWSIAYTDIHSVAAGYDDKISTYFILDIVGGRTLDEVLRDVYSIDRHETTLDTEIVDRLCEYYPIKT